MTGQRGEPADPDRGSRVPAGLTGAAADQGIGTGERQVPFFCPYCGEEDLRPAGASAGAWSCQSCARGFQLRFTGVLRSDPGRENAALP